VILSSQYLLTGPVDDGQYLASSPSGTEEPDATYSCEQRTGSVLEQRASSTSDHEQRSSDVYDMSQEHAGPEFISYVNETNRSPDGVNSVSEYIAMSETAAVSRLPMEQVKYVNSPSASNSADLYSYVRTPDLSRFHSQPKVGLRSERPALSVNNVKTSRVDELQDSVPSTNHNLPLKSNSLSNDSPQPSTNQNTAVGNSNQSREPVSDMVLSAPGIKMSSQSRVFTRNTSNDSKV